ncbi:MAG: SDR family NAD(P)-dependent oxidoreductase [Pseudomonadota bacterium]
MKDPRSLLITGASSGIGEALARAYAAPGIHLALAGRNSARLSRVAQACKDLGAEVATGALDVTQRADLAAWIKEIDADHPLDLVVANAGISAGTGGGGEDQEQSRAIFAVNMTGVANTLFPAVELMAPRKRGQLAIMSSLASFRGFPGAPAYCASKAAVRVWGESLRGSLHKDGLEVSVICPGYVKSRMTDANDFPMPFLMEADKAAGIIKRGLAKNKGRIVFPLRLYAMVWLLAALPPSWIDPLLRQLPEKT